MISTRYENSISRSGTQLALQLLMFGLIVLLKPTQACFGSGQCCPPSSVSQCSPTVPPCSSSSSPSRLLSGPSGGSYSRPLPPPPPPQPPVGIGYGGPYAQPPQQPVAPISSAVKPSYGAVAPSGGAFYQGPQNLPAPHGSSFYPSGSKGVAGNVVAGYDQGVGSGGKSGTPPTNIAPPPELPLPLPKQYIYDDNSMLSEQQLTPTAHNSYSTTAKQSVIPSGQPIAESVYDEIVSDHEITQQQQQQQQQQEKRQQQQLIAEKDQASTYVNDKSTSDNTVPVTTDSKKIVNKPEQLVSESSYDGGAKFESSVGYQSETPAEKHEIGAQSTAPVTLGSEFESIKEVKLEGRKDNGLAETLALYDVGNGNTITESRSIEPDDSTCNDPALKAVIESVLKEHRDNLDAARNIEAKASRRFGGRFNSIVSNSEFAYVNWYGKRNCQLQFDGRHSLTWED